jgi:hypothetical protein
VLFDSAVLYASESQCFQTSEGIRSVLVRDMTRADSLRRTDKYTILSTGPLQESVVPLQTLTPRSGIWPPLKEQAGSLLKLHTKIKPLRINWLAQGIIYRAPTPSPTRSGLGPGARKGWAFIQLLPHCFYFVCFCSSRSFGSPRFGCRRGIYSALVCDMNSAIWTLSYLPPGHKDKHTHTHTL